jgi:hypothetical protein
MVFARESQWILEPGRPVSRTNGNPVLPGRSVVRAYHVACFAPVIDTPPLPLPGIPVSSVGSYISFIRTPNTSILIVASSGNARALADDGALATPARYSQGLTVPNATETSHSNVLQPPSPSVEGNRRMSLTPGGTTKVLADLQTGVVNARNALENTKAQLRLSQRSVAQLTRQTEDLKEVRERLRLENEGLNNVVARKERLLQEVRFLHQ